MSALLQVRDLENPTNTILLSLAERQISEHYIQRRKEIGLDETTTPSLNNATSSTVNPINGGTLIANRDKGKGKATEADIETTAETSTTTTDFICFENAHEFHLITRFLELRVLNADAKEAAASTSTSAVVSKPFTLPPQALVLPSIVTNTDTPMSPKQVLLAHFSSQEGNRWCERGLGLEIWRKECELKHGSLEGGDWQNSWDRLEASLKRGYVSCYQFIVLEADVSSF